jgi:hypothetical protein
MASTAHFRTVAGRAAAILTTGEVAGATLDLSDAWAGHVAVDLDFTLGSLTNVIVRFYGSEDGSTWKPIANGSVLMTETLTATATRLYLVPALAGVKYFRASVQGTGVVTSSSCAFSYKHWRRASQ